MSSTPASSFESQADPNTTTTLNALPMQQDTTGTEVFDPNLSLSSVIDPDLRAELIILFQNTSKWLPHVASHPFTLTPDDVVTLINLATISFAFPDPSTTPIYTQSRAILLAHYKSVHRVFIHIPNLRPTLTLAWLIDDKPLEIAVVNAWKRILASENTRAEDILTAIQVAEQLDIFSLLGTAYYYMMLRGPETWFSLIPDLQDAQHRRLVQGYERILEESDRLELDPPILEHSPTCVDRDGCDDGWKKLWRDTVERVKEGSGVARESIGDLLWVVHNELPDGTDDGKDMDTDFDVSEGMSKSCLGSAWAAGLDRFEDVMKGENLMKYFGFN